MSSNNKGIPLDDLSGESSINKTIYEDDDFEIEDEDPLTTPISAWETGLSQTRINLIVLSMYIGVFLAGIDGTVVSTLIGTIASEFDSLPKLPWIATAYLLSSATFQALYGKVSDIFGRRALLISSNLIFFIGTFICYLSSNVNQLILGRFISGIGGGGLIALSSMAVADLIPLKARGIYTGVANIAFACGSGLGSIMGGFFASHENLGGWRGAFACQLPLSMLSIIAIFLLLKFPKGSPGLGVHGDDIKVKLKMIDWWGSLTLITFLISFLTAASLGGKQIPFKSFEFVGLLIVTLVFLFAFIYVELKALNPILPIRLLGIRTVRSVATCGFFIAINTFTTYFILPIYFSAVLGLSAQEIGQRFTPNFFSIIIGAMGIGYYMKRTGKYYAVLLICGAIIMFGELNIYLVSPKYSTFSQYLLLFIPSLGTNGALTALMLGLVASVDVEHQASTLSINYVFRSCGSTLGVSIGSAIFAKKLQNELEANVLAFEGTDGHTSDELQQIVFKAIHNSDYIYNGAPDFIQQTLKDAYSSSTKMAFGFCFACTVIAFAHMFLVGEHKLHSTLDRADDDEED